MRNLAKAPIIEALAQINFESAQLISDKDLQGFLGLFPNFTNEEIQQVQIKPLGSPELSKFGYRLSNEKTGEFIQITKDFFAYSKVSKYKDWDSFRGDARDALSQILVASRATNVNRIALRYINKFEIPSNFLMLPQALKVYPVLGELIDNKPDTVMIQYTIPISSIEARANVIMRLDRAADEKNIVLFDIDTFMTGKFKPSINDILVEMDKLRLSKNEIFEKSLTDATISNFDK